MNAPDSDDFQSAYELFQELCDRTPEEQAAALAGEQPALRKRVQDLLRADALGTAHLDGPPLVDSAAASTDSAPIPKRIGEFRILAQIGRGGMGVVFEAEQDQPRRTVALKLIRPDRVSKEHLRRFKHEAEGLGWLNHPGIAQVFAAGTADSAVGTQPYLAMELVRGERIDVFATEHELDTRARLELVALVADAIHHAHKKGVIHRDLKPANVLVDAGGQPKVLDFGVARVTNHDLAASVSIEHTGEGALLGTLAYMSPEQIAADPSKIDTRCDVYALGVMAYELLSGQRPHELRSLSLPEAARTITEDDPTSLGALKQRLRGDIETIVAKAMAKEKEQRYASAEDFARDVRRFLADEPILARPPSTRYQLSKFVRRRKALVVAISSLFLALLAGSTISTVLYLRGEDRLVEITSAREAEATARAAEQRQLAAALANLDRAREAEALSKIEAETASEVSAFLESLFLEASPERALGVERNARDLLFAGAATIENTLEHRPELRMRLTWLIGRVLYRLGLLEDASPLIDESLAAARRLDQTALIAEIAGVRALIFAADGRFELALPLEEEVVAFQRAGDPMNAQMLGTALVNRASSRSALGQTESALVDAREALQLARDHPELGPSILAMGEIGLANVLAADEDYAEAEQLLTTAIARLAPEQDPGHPQRLRAATLLGHCWVLQGRAPEAAALAEDTLNLCREVLPPSSDITRTALDVLAVANLRMGRIERVEELYANLLHDPADNHRYRVRELRSLGNLGIAYRNSGQPVKALSLLARLCDSVTKSHAGDSLITVQLYNNYTTQLADEGRFAEALPLARTAYTAQTRGGWESLRLHLSVRRILLQCLLETGGANEEIDLLATELHELARRDLSEDDVELPYYILWAVRAQRSLGNLDKWLAALQDCEASLNDRNDPSGGNRRAMVGYYRARYVKTHNAEAFEAARARLLKSLGE